MLPSLSRLLLVHASPLCLRVVERMLQKQSSITLVGRAQHGREALEMWKRLRPDVILCSPSLPILDGPSLTREIMSQNPTPILALPSGEADPLLAAMIQAGAIDFFVPPHSFGGDNAPENDELFAKIGRVLRVPLISRRRVENQTPTMGTGSTLTERKAAPKDVLAASSAEGGKQDSPDSERPDTIKKAAPRTPQIVAIGASTGGPPTLALLLGALPKDFPFPVVVVQHISKGFLEEMIEWLNGVTKIEVKIAKRGEIARRGVAYFAPEELHLEIAPSGRMTFSEAPPFMGHRPSVNVLFHSIARNYGASAYALLLTGMGSDGALGLKAISEAGGQTWVQSEESCTVFGMPKEAIHLGAARAILSPTEMAARLLALR